MMQQIEFYAMGCQMLVILESEHPLAAKCLAEVPAWFEAWEQSLSRFRPDSELNYLNTHPGESVAVSEVMWQVLLAALNAYRKSNRLVSPTILPALETAGYDRSFDQLGSSVGGGIAQRTAVPADALEAIELDKRKHTVRIPAGVRLDFGGVAKGWAAHQAMRQLRSLGPVLVDAGGDIAISDRQSGDKRWPVGINDPLGEDEQLMLLMLGRSGVATSGRDYRHWLQAGAPRHHIIDPHTGTSAETDVGSATVVAATVLGAEMAAKTVLILGSLDGLDWLDSRRAYAGLLVLEDGSVQLSKGFEDYLWSQS
ncbi:MAG: FAD:protein FMN transferase [Anaerolineales bacterium]|nr:FAD:protein FMN transferase [Anaerolineales bacterium]